MKISWLLVPCILGLTQGVMAASCEQDVEQMKFQIAKYKSISTKKCGFNSSYYGVNKVAAPKKQGQNQCQSVCYYAQGDGMQGVPCNWEISNWGDTLSCAN